MQSHFKNTHACVHAPAYPHKHTYKTEVTDPNCKKWLYNWLSMAITMAMSLKKSPPKCTQIFGTKTTSDRKYEG